MWGEGSHVPELVEAVETHEKKELPNYFYKFRDEFLYILEHAVPRTLGNIDDLRPEIKGTHTNEVLLVELDAHQLLKNQHQSNLARIFEVHYEGKPLVTTIYKPRSGENPYRLREFNIQAMYPRELAYYLLDYYGNFGVAPPTIGKVVDQEIGSLQLYIPPEVADVPSRVPGANSETLAQSKSWKRTATLDRLAHQADRNHNNYLVYKDNPAELAAAIDHGCTFCARKPNDVTIAYNHYVKNPEEAKLDDTIEACLRSLIQNESELMVRHNDNELDEARSLIDAYNVFDTAHEMLKRGTIIV